MVELDLVLPAAVSLIASASVLLYGRFHKKISFLLEESSIGARDVVVMVASMGLMITAIAFIPKQAVQILFIIAYSYMLFSFAYIAFRKWYVAILPPAAFVLLYNYYWELPVFNLFVALFAVMIPVYVGSIFSWRTTWIFVVLLTAMDIIQVFGTGFMVASASKMIELKLPVLLILPTFPAKTMIGLGLGDIFMSGLLAVQTSLKRGRNAGIMTAAMVGVAIFVFEAALFNVAAFRFFPATVVVIAGWMASLGVYRLTMGASQEPRGKRLGRSFEVVVRSGRWEL